MPLDLPSTICFRVTRYCNARCSFCLAPPDGAHPDVGTLTRRLDWLLLHGVKTIHFCGGEPTIHPGLPTLLEHVDAIGGKIKLTTNGITMPDVLLTIFHATDTQVKVSLHGNREHHDAIVGRKAFEHTTRTLGRLVAAGIRTFSADYGSSGRSGGCGVGIWILLGNQGASTKYHALHSPRQWPSPSRRV